eukprot:11209677-Lingulodinium_polyedra.AAC.1
MVPYQRHATCTTVLLRVVRKAQGDCASTTHARGTFSKVGAGGRTGLLGTLVQGRAPVRPPCRLRSIQVPPRRRCAR